MISERTSGHSEFARTGNRHATPQRLFGLSAFASSANALIGSVPAARIEWGNANANGWLDAEPAAGALLRALSEGMVRLDQRMRLFGA
ncbi:hypothetical protein [Actinokineospora pegani]|uniref:hypothetical protein n=1 Tax=Actinokineospora pegani TaxID=2654637 RepID=UPI0012EA675E|nr:hypothetical protein [Actinokineospora pegani]